MEHMKGSICFHVFFPGELAAGLRAFNDSVKIACGSGDFGGEPGEFEEFMRQCLADWYDCSVVISPNCPPHLPDFYRGSAVRTGKHENTQAQTAANDGIKHE